MQNEIWKFCGILTLATYGSERDNILSGSEESRLGSGLNDSFVFVSSL